MAKQTMEERIAAAVAAALAAQTAPASTIAAVQVPQSQPEVASLAIPDAAWTALEDAVVTSFDTQGRDTTFLGAVLSFATQVPSDWRGKPLPSAIVDTHADKVRARLAAKYGDVSKLSKDEQDRMKRTCDQKHSRAKALFTCSTILAQAKEQGIIHGVVDAGKLCTELKDASYNLAAVVEARKAAASALPEYAKDVAALIDRILNMKAEGDTIPACLNAKAKAELVLWADNKGLTLKHGNTHRNNPLATG